MSYNDVRMSHVPVHIDENAGLPALKEISTAQIELYLSLLETSGRKRYSAIMAGVEPGRMAYLMKNDKELKSREIMSLQGYAELIDAAVHDRAVNGVSRGVYYKGQRIATERHYSDQLLMMLAKAHNPKYRDHVSVDANVRAGVLVVQTSLDPDDWEKQYGRMRIDQSRINSVCTESSEAKQQNDG